MTRIRSDDKYNGLTWGAPGIQATNLLYLKNSEAAIEANNTWFYVYPDDEEKNRAVTSGWKWPIGVTFTTAEADELDEIAQNIPTFVEESFAEFLTGSKDINDDAVWEKISVRSGNLQICPAYLKSVRPAMTGTKSVNNKR